MKDIIKTTGTFVSGIFMGGVTMLISALSVFDKNFEFIDFVPIVIILLVSILSVICTHWLAETVKEEG